jgi:hypothetical protein
MADPKSLDPEQRAELRRQFFRLVLPHHLKSTLVDFPHLFDVADASHAGFKQAPGFPHGTIDGLLTSRGQDHLLAALEDLAVQPVWEPEAPAGVARLSAELFMPPALRALFGELGTETFLAAMHSLTGVARLLPDPDRLEDGLLAIPSGERHIPSATFARHPRLKLQRRARLVLFLCREWQDDWGGHIEFRSAARPDWTEVIPARPNRCIVWNTPHHARATQPLAVSHPRGAPLYCVTASFYTVGPTASGKQGG